MKLSKRNFIQGQVYVFVLLLSAVTVSCAQEDLPTNSVMDSVASVALESTDNSAIEADIGFAKNIVIESTDSPVVEAGVDSATEIIEPTVNSSSVESAVNSEIQKEQNSPAESSGIASQVEQSSEDVVKSAWEASSKSDIVKVEGVVTKCLDLYGSEAKLQQAQLKNFPNRGEEKNYQSLNDVATCLFVRGEVLMNTGKTEDAIKQFQDIIENYKWAQAWDPRGWYWSVAEKSQASIDVLTGKNQDEDEPQEKFVRTLPNIFIKGKDKVVDYTKYGKFLNVGTENYHYSITDLKGLSEAVGEGIYPNTTDIYQDQRYKDLKKAGKLNGSHWDFVNTDDLEAAFYKWATAPESWGVRLFYIGMLFEKAKMYHEALRAYHALVVHYPNTIGWTYWQTPWYPGQAAVAKIRHIIRTNPELSLSDMWMKIQIKNGYDNDPKNDVVITFPGKLVEKSLIDKAKDSLQLGKAPLEKEKKRVGSGKVQLVQYENDHWQLLVENKPFVIKGMTYAPTKIGQSPDKGTLVSWMDEDTNQNGLADGPFDAWVDANKNNKQDEDEPIVGDFKLMKEMGTNTLRIYHQPLALNKELLRKMHEQYGFYVIMGDFVGKYTLGSGATWFEGTDYDNPEHRKNMMESVRKMVMEFKDEPYILLWLLGNENNYGVATNADKKPESYFKFVNEVALMIKSIDPNHPVAVGNGDSLFLDIFGKNAPDVDIFAANIYRGDYGFGSFWEQVLDASGKPAFITEYGCPGYAKHMSPIEYEESQEHYHLGNWVDIEENMAGTTKGVGNSLGGVVFEWTDEWWKNYEPFAHDRKSDAIGPFPGGFYHEEWFGITSQGNGTHSPFMRQLRKSYFLYKDLWNRS